MAEVLKRTTLPAHALVPEVAPVQHDLGAHDAFLGRHRAVAERLDREREFVVLGKREGVVDAIATGEVSVAPCVGNHAKDVDAKNRCGSRQHQARAPRRATSRA